MANPHVKQIQIPTEKKSSPAGGPHDHKNDAFSLKHSSSFEMNLKWLALFDSSWKSPIFL